MKLTLEVSDRAMDLLRELTGSELWGKKVEETAQILLYRQLQLIDKERREADTFKALR